MAKTANPFAAAKTIPGVVGKGGTIPGMIGKSKIRGIGNIKVKQIIGSASVLKTRTLKRRGGSKMMKKVFGK